MSTLNAVIRPACPSDRRKTVELRRIRAALGLQLEGVALKAYIADSLALYEAPPAIFSNTGGYPTLSGYVLRFDPIDELVLPDRPMPHLEDRRIVVLERSVADAEARLREESERASRATLSHRAEIDALRRAHAEEIAALLARHEAAVRAAPERRDVASQARLISDADTAEALGRANPGDLYRSLTVQAPWFDGRVIAATREIADRCFLCAPNIVPNHCMSPEHQMAVSTGRVSAAAYLVNAMQNLRGCAHREP
jgi:hypothetical protein